MQAGLDLKFALRCKIIERGVQTSRSRRLWIAKIPRGKSEPESTAEPSSYLFRRRVWALKKLE